MPPMPCILHGGSRRLALVLALLLLASLLALAAPRAEAATVRCAGTFRVLHDDHVGALDLPRGNYRITILASGRPSCARASGLFTNFLEDYDGRLPGGWRVNASASTFLRSPGVGFRVSPAGSGEGGGGGEAGGGGRHPEAGRLCTSTFRVLHNDRIGPLRVPRGPYMIVLLQRRGLSCAQASRLFTRFLDDFTGRLQAPWVLEQGSASFRRGASGPGFRIKPAR